MSTPTAADLSPALVNSPVWPAWAPFQDRAPCKEKILGVESKLSGIRIIEIKTRKGPDKSGEGAQSQEISESKPPCF